MATEEWLLPAITNLYIGTLFIILTLKFINHYRKMRVMETLFLIAFFGLSSLTSIIVGIIEIIYKTRRFDFNPLFNIMLDTLIISYLLILLLFPIILLEEKSFGVVYGIILGAIILISFVLQNPLILRGAILIIAFYGVSFVFLYIYLINKSIKAITFSLGLITLGTGLALANQPPPIVYLALFLGALGSTIIFVGQIVAPKVRTARQQWISKLRDKIEVR